MKKWMSLFLAMMMVLSLAACGSSKTETKEPETSTAEPAAEEQEAAAEFLRWLNTAGNDAYMCAVSGYMPVVTAAMDEEALKEVYAATPLLKTATELMQFGITSPQGKAKAACDKAINDYCKLIWSEPDTSIESIVEQVTSKAQYEIEANQ